MGTPLSSTPSAATAGSNVSGRFGPADRVTFFEEQRRNRRRSWRFSVLSVATVLVTGIPVSVVVTPFIYVFLLLTGNIANAIRPLDAATVQQMRGLAYLLPRAFVRLMDAKSLAAVPSLLPSLLVLVLPGALVMLALWLAVRLTFRETGVGGVLLRLGARPPRPDDFEEHQLVNVVEEMAVAAGVATPRVLLLDVPAANAVAIGTSLHDATIIVTRGLLDLLNREQAEAVIAHVVGSVGNGDLRIAHTLFSVYQTFGLLSLLLNSAFGPRSRDALWSVLRLAFMRRGTVSVEEDAGALAELLERSGAGDGQDDLSDYMDDSKHHRGAVRSMLRAPLMFGIGFPTVTAQFTIGMASTLLFGPAFAALWRARRRLADATAVQLTRNPESLASALERMQMSPVDVGGAEGISLLFAMWKGGAAERGRQRPTMFSGFQPSLGKRLKRLQAQGAALREGRRATRGAVLVLVLIGIIIVPLLLIALVLTLFVLVMMLVLDVAFMSIMLIVADQVLHLAFTYGPVVIHKYGPPAVRWVKGRLA